MVIKHLQSIYNINITYPKKWAPTRTPRRRDSCTWSSAWPPPSRSWSRGQGWRRRPFRRTASPLSPMVGCECFGSGDVLVQQMPEKDFFVRSELCRENVILILIILSTTEIFTLCLFPSLLVIFCKPWILSSSTCLCFSTLALTSSGTWVWCWDST